MGTIDYSQTINVFNRQDVDPDNLLYPLVGNDYVGLDTVFINGKRFNKIARDSLLGFDNFTLGEEPTRNKLGAFENMDDIDAMLVAQCDINLKYINIKDFKDFRWAINQKYFNVVFFNVDLCKWVKREMYCSKKERGALYYFNPKLLGVLDLKMTFIATNRDLIPYAKPKISFYANGNNIAVPSEVIVEYGNQYYVPSAPSSTGHNFLYWDTDGNNDNGGDGFRFEEGNSFTAFYDTKLYAVYDNKVV